MAAEASGFDWRAALNATVTIARREGLRIAEEAKLATTVGDIAEILQRSLVRVFGAQALETAGLVGAAVAAIIALWVVFGMYRFFTRPQQHLSSVSKAKPKSSSKGKQHDGKKGQAKSPVEADAPAEEPAAKAESPSDSHALPVSKRTRKPTVSSCGKLKGIPGIGACGVSPDGYILVVASREKRFVRVYPQYTKLDDKATDYITLGEDIVPRDAVITRVAFAMCGGIFALIDDVSGEVRVLHYTADPDQPWDVSPKPSLTGRKQTYKVPPKLLKGNAAQVFLADDGLTLFMCHEKEGVVEGIDLVRGVSAGNTKVKTGNTAVWGAARGGLVAAAGSYITTTRTYHLAGRGTGSAALTLAQQASLNTARVRRLALTPDGTRLVVVLDEDNRVEVWDLDVNYGVGEEPRRLAEWRDDDYAGATAIAVSYPEARSGSRRRDLTVVLAKGGDFVVYRVPQCHEASKVQPAQRVAEVFDAHDGEDIRTIDVACRGAAVATSNDIDPRNIVRLWPVSA